MSHSLLVFQRLASVVQLINASHSEYLGRTAIVKCEFFLQILRGVPLRYDFTLYSYGPFDSSVLTDLAYGNDIGVLSESLVPYRRGYGYEIRVGESADEIVRRARGFLEDHRDAISYVGKRFGSLGAADLELESTLIYLDREANAAGQSASSAGIAERLVRIKPRFTLGAVQQRMSALAREGLLLTSG